jgi:succinate dehydrogenase/fumarate reductase flavoprotein subunit
LFGTPIERLKKMNQPAIDLYKSNGIDLAKDYLEIAVCAQHNNGGIQGSIWWESNIKHLFPVGEVNGTHGVYRPGGSALNSGQVGSMRAALFISKRYTEAPPEIECFLASTEEPVKSQYRMAKQMVGSQADENVPVHKAREEIQERMSACGAPIRTPERVNEAIKEAWDLYSRLKKEIKVSSVKELPAAFKNLDLCLTHALYLEAIGEYLEKGGKSRGSYLVMDPEGDKPCEALGDEWKFSLNQEEAFVNQKILQICLDEDAKVKKQWVDIRPIPQEETWYENVWNEFRQDKIIK